MLLLYLMSELFPTRTRAIYIDHQLQSMSEEWGNLVQKHADALKIPCVLQKVSVESGNLEQQARDARYQAYCRHLTENDILVLGHHQQDQAETLLLRLFSGAGVNGLAAMQQIDVRQDMTIWRPFLDLSREQIEHWSQQLGFDYVTDPTNADPHYDRAWCRTELWEVLQQRFPQMQSALARNAQLMQDADDIFIQGLRNWKVKDAGGNETTLYHQVWQAGVILLPVQSVGVMGDERTYERAVALRAVTSTDAMTADWAHLPYEFLGKVSNDIINKVKGVNRVTYDISSKPPSTIEWE